MRDQAVTESRRGGLSLQNETLLIRLFLCSRVSSIEHYELPRPDRQSGRRGDGGIMNRLRTLLIGAALMTGASALAVAQPAPDRDHDRDRDRRVYVYNNHDRDNRGYYDRDDRGYYDRDDRGYYQRWGDRDDRWRRDHDRDRDDWRWRNRNRGRDWDHDGDRR